MKNERLIDPNRIYFLMSFWKNLADHYPCGEV